MSNPYVLGGNIPFEGERLLEQCRGLEREARWLLDRINVQPGWRTLDVGCGPLGVLDLLSQRVGAEGEAVGLEREEHLVRMGEALLNQRGIRNARIVRGDAYAPNLPRAAFDLVHARLLLINLTDPRRAVGEMAALVRPGGIVAIEDIDQVPWLCEPAHPSWDALVDAFLRVWRSNGLDPLVGRRLPALLHAVGLTGVEVEVHARADPVGAYHRKHLLTLIQTVRAEIVARGLLKEREVEALSTALEPHLDDPRTLVTRPLLFQAWGRKPN